MEVNDMTLGQKAYEEDIRREPYYSFGAPRARWEELSKIVQNTWHRNPTPRAKLPAQQD